MHITSKDHSDFLLGAKIVYVDENSINRTLAQVLLNDTGAHCTCVSTVHEMMDVLGRQPLDLLMLDIATVNADSDAFELVKRDPHFRGLPLIAVGTDEAEAKKIGARYFVPTPLDIVHLLTTLAQARAEGVKTDQDGTIGRTALLARVGGKVEAASELLSHFIHDYAGHAVLIKQATERAETEKAAFILRNLRAASSAIGADRLYRLAGTIQDELEHSQSLRFEALALELKAAIQGASELKGEFATSGQTAPLLKQAVEGFKKRGQTGPATLAEEGPAHQEDSFKEAYLLAVDDSLANLKFIEASLSDEYRVEVASSGEEALQIARRNPAPAIILLDVTMPGIDGYETCRQLKEDPRTRSIPVIFLTSLSKEEDEQRGLALGAVDYIRKPFSIPILKARVKSQLELLRYREYLETLVEQRTQALRETQREVVFRLALAAEYRDNDTGSHIKRISYYSMTLAEKMGFPRQEADTLYYASSMHDVGKIGIPDHILLKPGKLTPDEWKIMKEHTTIGAGLLEGHPSELLTVASKVALTHHEKWDGSGYPSGLKGEEIPIEGRIVAICDVFDALLSERPYKRKWSTDEALDEINRLSGSHFDPVLVRAFNDTYPEFLNIKERFGD